MKYVDIQRILEPRDNLIYSSNVLASNLFVDQVLNDKIVVVGLSD